jgi:4-hydroxybenzoate polyprenyltransferase
MIALQASIGALNDVVDAPSDAGRKPGKPIPAGLVTARTGRAVVVIGAGLGLALAVPSGAGLVMVAGLGLVIGYAYDLAAKGTAWSWVPLAVGIPLLPVFGWFGATARLPAPFVVLLPAAVLAGAALAIANARADLEHDAATGLESVATRLGPARAWSVHAALLAIVVLVALVSLWFAEGPPFAMASAMGAVVVIGAGVGWARKPTASPARRERAWEIQAIGLALLAAAWLAGARGLG